MPGLSGTITSQSNGFAEGVEMDAIGIYAKGEDMNLGDGWMLGLLGLADRGDGDRDDDGIRWRHGRRRRCVRARGENAM